MIRISIEIKELQQKEDKQYITRMILETLPDWFGIESAREEYILNSSEQPF